MSITILNSLEESKLHFRWRGSVLRHPRALEPFTQSYLSADSLTELCFSTKAGGNSRGEGSVLGGLGLLDGDNRY
jgi:hypothetical protein